MITTSTMTLLASPFVVAAFGYSLILLTPVVVVIIMALGGLGDVIFDLLENQGKLLLQILDDYTRVLVQLKQLSIKSALPILVVLSRLRGQDTLPSPILTLKLTESNLIVPKISPRNEDDSKVVLPPNPFKIYN